MCTANKTKCSQVDAILYVELHMTMYNIVRENEGYLKYRRDWQPPRPRSFMTFEFSRLLSYNKTSTSGAGLAGSASRNGEFSQLW